MPKAAKHVLPNPKGGWSVRQSGAARATRTFQTQQDAEKFGRASAKKERTELYVHRSDGTVRKKDNFESNHDQPKSRR